MIKYIFCKAQVQLLLVIKLLSVSMVCYQMIATLANTGSVMNCSVDMWCHIHTTGLTELRLCTFSKPREYCKWVVTMATSDSRTKQNVYISYAAPNGLHCMAARWIIKL